MKVFDDQYLGRSSRAKKNLSRKIWDNANMDKHDKNETITDVEMLLNEGNTHCGENLQQ